MTIRPEVYSVRMTPLLVSPNLEGHSGAMFNNKAEAMLASKNLAEPSHVRAVIEASGRIVTRAPAAA